MRRVATLGHGPFPCSLHDPGRRARLATEGRPLRGRDRALLIRVHDAVDSRASGRLLWTCALHMLCTCPEQVMMNGRLALAGPGLAGCGARHAPHAPPLPRRGRSPEGLKAKGGPLGRRSNRTGRSGAPSYRWLSRIVRLARARWGWLLACHSRHLHSDSSVHVW